MRNSIENGKCLDVLSLEIVHIVSRTFHTRILVVVTVKNGTNVCDSSQNGTRVHPTARMIDRNDVSRKLAKC